jgi:hypothetical protein
MKITAFWDITLCSLEEVDPTFQGCILPHHQDYDHPDDGGSMHLSNMNLL